jgi:alcohol dehydrogenase class IV
MVAQFNIPSTVIVGAGASKELAAQAKRIKARSVLVVTDSYIEPIRMSLMACFILKIQELILW